jgi:hypothetical protein
MAVPNRDSIHNPTHQERIDKVDSSTADNALAWTLAAKGENDEEVASMAPLASSNEVVDEPPAQAFFLASQLHDAGVDSKDVADALRDQGVDSGSLIKVMRAAGYAPSEVMYGLQHFSSVCSHEGGEGIRVLPVFPAARRRINGMDNDIRDTATQMWDAIAMANNPAQFFNFGGLASWVKASSCEQAVLEEITVKRMHFLMGEVADWYKIVKGQEYPTRPPKQVAEHLVAAPHPPLPRLRRLVTAPVFDASGQLVVRNGFHDNSGIFLAPRGLTVQRVAHAPVPMEIEKAKNLILHELLGDFPFVDDSDLVNAVALLLLPFVRELIDGPTPLHLITKPSPGSGGTLLAEVLLFPAIGKRPPMQGLPEGEAEIQRRITSALLASPAAIVFDNIKTSDQLDSNQLSSALTAMEWEDRQIRTSTLLTLPISNAWIATGNNVRVSDEIARRTIPIRLDPKMENPFERTGFRHDPIMEWVAGLRSDLVWSALTLVQGWVVEGMPQGQVSVGKFETWASTMSGILEVAGLPGLRSNWHEWNGSRPSEEKDLQQVVMVWRANFGDSESRASQLLPVLGPLLGIDVDGGRSAATILGARLRSLQGRSVDGFEVLGRDASGSTLWRLSARDSDVSDSE